MGVESTHMALGCVSRCELKCCLKHAGEQKELPVSLPLRTQQMHWKEAALLQSKQLLSPPLLSDRTMLAGRRQLTEVMHFPPVPANAQNPRVPAREFSEGIARAGVPERIVSAAWPTHQTPARGARSSKGGRLLQFSGSAPFDQAHEARWGCCLPHTRQDACGSLTS